MTAVHRTGIFTDTGGTQYLLWGASLYNYEGNWYVEGGGAQNSDSTYQNSNVVVTLENTPTAVNVNGNTGSKVVSLIAGVDNSLADLGVTVGVSFVGGKAVVKFFLNDSGTIVPVEPGDNRLILDSARVWLQGWFLV